ncbi:MAG: Com family DNA-binding transcriptional regulator [Phenylobacterium sp.]|nr:Com family DNA-binding transcriptional regulator [Phenylobacterium sp.]
MTIRVGVGQGLSCIAVERSGKADVRCGSCRALLLRARPGSEIEIKCRRCGAFNAIALRP